MADTRKVTGAIEVKDSTAERVAFDLYKYIRELSPENQDKELALFARCNYHVRDYYRSVEEIKRNLKSG